MTTLGRSELNRALLEALLPAAELILSEQRAQEPIEPFEDWLFSQARTEVGPFPDWPYLRKMARAFASGKDVTILKRRQILASWVAAAYFHWNASRHPFNHSAVVSSGKREAAKQARRIKYIAKQDGYNLKGVDFIPYPNGTEINILPSTEIAGIGEELPGGVHFDEYSKHPYGAANLAAIGPGVANSGGQTIITSTTHPDLGEAGCFYDVWQGDNGEDFLSEDEDFYHEDDNVIRLFFNRYCRPDQGDEFIAQEAKRPGYTEDVLSAYYPRTPAEAFKSRAGLVYPQFSSSLHVCEPEVSWSECTWRGIGYDPGGRDPAGLLLVGVYRALPREATAYPNVKGQWRHHVYDVWRTEGAISAYDVRDYFREAGQSRIHHLAVGETGGSTLVETLKALGLPAYRPPMDKKEGIGYLRWMLEHGFLTVSPNCTELIEEFGQYWIHEARQTLSPRSDNFRTTTPAHHHADLLDALRYIVMGLRRAFPQPAPTIEQASLSTGWERAG